MLKRRHYKKRRPKIKKTMGVNDFDLEDIMPEFNLALSEFKS